MATPSRATMYEDLFILLLIYLFHFYADSAEQVHAVRQPVLVLVDDSPYACLDYQLRAFYAGGCRHIQGRALGAVAGLGDLGYGVGLRMQHIRLGDAVLVLADVLEARRGAVVSVGDDHPVLDEQGAHLAAFAVGVPGPYFGHGHVFLVELIHLSSGKGSA